MKKITLGLFAFVLCLLCVFALASCDEGGSTPNGGSSQTEQGGTSGSEGGNSGGSDDGGDETPHTHAWSDWSVTKAATCLAIGEAKRTCACGESETKTVDATGHQSVTHCDATAAGCLSAGNTEHWVCSDCDNYFSDENCTAKITDKTSVVIDALHPEAVTHYVAVAETCTTDGNVEYWDCTVCDKYFSDAVCKNQITDKTIVVIAATGHQSVTHHAAVAAGCTTAGNTEYWVCADCDTYFSNENCTVKIADKTSVVIGALHPEAVTRYAAVVETCTTDGNVEYWDCTVCDKYFSDAACKNQITDKTTVVIAATGHQSVTHHVAVAVGCTTAGNMEYWECADCDTYFSDENCTVMVADKASVVIAATGHQYNANNVCTGCGDVLTYTLGLAYKLNEEETAYTVTGIGTATDAEIVIPVFYEGLPVTSIGSSAFENCKSLTSITISEGITSIGDSAFDGCSGLESITIPSSVTSIGDFAFNGCSGLTTIIFAEGSQLTSIGLYAFYGCTSLTSVTIPEGVTRFENNAFGGCCSLSTIYLNATAEYVGGLGAFWGAGGYSGITVYVGANVTKIISGLFYGGYVCNVVFAENSQCTSIEANAFDSDRASFTTITIPPSMTSIGKFAFGNCSKLVEINFNATAMNDCEKCIFGVDAGLEGEGITVNVGANVTKIPARLFTSGGSMPMHIVNVVFALNGQCTSIGEEAFAYCFDLPSITIPSSVTSIGNSAFESCRGLTTVIFAEGSQLTSIGKYAFDGCSSLTSITIPASVTLIDIWAFDSCSGLTKVVISDIAAWCKISFGNYAATPLYEAKHLYLGENEITDLVIPAGVTSIGEYAFYNCSGLTTVIFAEGSQLTSIGRDAFNGCSGLESITIPASVTSIGIYAFNGCSSLTSITIPASVTSIGNSAFRGCSLTSAIFEKKSGWVVGYNDNISANSLDNASTAATYLTNTYVGYKWKRS